MLHAETLGKIEMEEIPTTNLISLRQMYNLLAAQPGDSSAPVLPIDLRAPDEYNACHIRNAINIFLTEEYDGPITSRLLESECSSKQEGIGRFRFRAIAKVVLYGGSAIQTRKLFNFFTAEKKARSVLVLNGTLNDFFMIFPFRCNGLHAPIDTHDIYPSQILDFLFLGSQQNSSSRDQFSNLIIQRVLNCASLEVSNTFDTLSNNGEKYIVKYCDLPIDDSPSQDLTNYFETATRFIEKSRIQKKNVLVHCRAGRSRSAAMVIAYLITYQHQTFTQAFEYVKQCRPNISINSGFLNQLKFLSSRAKTGEKNSENEVRQ